MAAPVARIVHGNLPADVSLVDEPDMLVQSITTTAGRDEKEYKGANKAVGGLEYTNPILNFKFNAYISSRAGLCDQHPGTTVTELANFAGARFGFDPAVGTLVYKDASTSSTLTDAETIDFTVTHYPFLED